jgi:hypothetical protein
MKAPKQNWKYDIGFLVRCPMKLVFRGGEVSPVKEFAELVHEVGELVHEDHGYYYPPIIRQWRTGIEFTEEGRREKEPELVKGSRRQALLFSLPPTHVIRLSNRTSQSEYGRGDEALILHALAFLFGTRLQFSDWYFDMRVPISKDTRDFFISDMQARAENVLSTALRLWRGWTRVTQERVVNALYMNSRSPSYEWDWERFTIDYMVFDALYKVTCETRGLNVCGHKARLSAMCDHYGVPRESRWLQTIYNLRNELYHESLWDGHQPGLSTSEEAFRASLRLRDMNMRLIAGVLGYTGKYLQSEWWVGTTSSF